MSGFKPYPAYKDSGVEFLGAVPEHWALYKLKYLAQFSGGGTPERENLAYWNGAIPWVSPKDMKVEIITGAEESITAEGLQNSSTSLVSPGTILIVVRSGILKHTIPISINDVEVALNQDMKALKLDSKKGLSNFFLRWVQGHNNNLLHAWLKQGATVESIEQEYLAGAIVPMPCVSEQKKIVNYLDYETARIDALIEEQQRLIELLKEKRQAVISHVVTKGLDATVPMKDSRVEWLGEVPAHWMVSKFGYISSVVRGGSPRPAGDPGLFNGDFSPWVTVAEITKNDEVYLEETETFLTKKGSDQCRVFSRGTLLLSNSGATLGVPKILMLDANANDGVVGFESITLDKEYSYFYLSTLTEGLRERAAGSGQPNLNTDIVKSIDVPIPPDDEVVKIVAAVKKLRAQFHFLSNEAAEGIGLLQERRSALISAAVTGKIDVRGWQPPTTSPTRTPEAETA